MSTTTDINIGVVGFTGLREFLGRLSRLYRLKCHNIRVPMIVGITAPDGCGKRLVLKHFFRDIDAEGGHLKRVDVMGDVHPDRLLDRLKTHYRQSGGKTSETSVTPCLVFREWIFGSADNMGKFHEIYQGVKALRKPIVIFIMSTKDITGAINGDGWYVNAMGLPTPTGINMSRTNPAWEDAANSRWKLPDQQCLFRFHNEPLKLNEVELVYRTFVANMWGAKNIRETPIKEEDMERVVQMLYNQSANVNVIRHEAIKSLLQFVDR